MTNVEIKALRKTLNETQMEFAERFGVAKITVSQWEAPVYQTCHRRPGPTAMKMLKELWEKVCDINQDIKH